MLKRQSHRTTVLLRTTPTWTINQPETLTRLSSDLSLYKRNYSCGVHVDVSSNFTSTSLTQDVNIGKELEKKQFAVADSSYPTEAVLKERLVNLGKQCKYSK